MLKKIMLGHVILVAFFTVTTQAAEFLNQKMAEQNQNDLFAMVSAAGYTAQAQETTLFAGKPCVSCESPRGLHIGPLPYIGISLGVTNLYSSRVAYQVITQNNNNVVQSHAEHFNGIPVNLFVGYGGLVTQRVYIGGEIFSTAATIQLSGNDQSRTNLKANFSFGFSFIPGFMLLPSTRAYVRLGYLRSRFSSAGQTVSAGQFGIGLQTSLTSHLDLRGEYDYATYHSFNNLIGKVYPPSSHSLNLGLVYNF